MWDGLVSIILVEGKKMIPMDDSGESGMRAFDLLVWDIVHLVGSNYYLMKIIQKLTLSIDCLGED